MNLICRAIPARKKHTHCNMEPHAANFSSLSSVVAVRVFGYPTLMWQSAVGRVVIGSLDLRVLQTIDVPNARMFACSRDSALIAIGELTLYE
jgi:hypothetical protein